VECLDDLTLVELVEGTATAERAAAYGHLDDCASCRSLFAEIVRSTHQEPALWGPSERPRSLGRFELQGKLGAGAMGEVYAAHDPQLDRQVALKLLGARGAGLSRDREALVGRLLREARMMAQLSHPNVVAVHEAGSIDGIPFVVMEQIDGQDLVAWRAAAPRSIPEILRVVIDVARGLAAVHGVGLVHRDVKPANILVGSDGRARLGDFGLAGVTAEPAAPAPTGEGEVQLTQTGEIVGTPAYMAPERLRGEAAVPASDQFSLCVLCYEVLFGKRPFAGATWDELSRAVLAGELGEPPADRGVPPWIVRAIRRGLATDPAARWPSVSALADELARRPVSRARIIAASTAALLVTGALVGLVVTRQPAGPTDPCAGGAAELAAIWNPARRAGLQRAFAAVDRPFAIASAERVSDVFDGYVSTWIAGHRTACEANRVRHVESDSLFDRRVACLEQRRQGFAALTAVLASTPAPGEVERAGAAAQALAPISDCTELGLGAQTTPRPSDPIRRRELAGLEERAAKLKAQHDLGNYKAALAEARQLVRDQSRLDHPPLAVEVLGLEALLLARTGDAKASEASIRDALVQAARAHDDAEIVRLWGLLINVVGAIDGRPGDALALVDPARLALVRAGSPPVLEAKLAANIGVVQRASGDLVAARASLERALHLIEGAYGTDAPETATVLTSYANVLQSQGEYAASLALHERILAIQSRTQGPLHPLTAQARVNVAAVADALGDHSRAALEARAALAILEPAWGKDNKRVLVIWNNLGVSLGYVGKTADAIAAFEHVIATGGQAPIMTADALSGLAKLAAQTGDQARAIELFERCLALRDQHQGASHPDTAIALVNLGVALQEVGRCNDALPRYLRAIPLLEASLGQAHPSLGQALAGQGRCLLDTGHRADALGVLARARAIAGRTDPALVQQIDRWLAGR